MVFEKVKAILSEQFDVEEDSITAETTLADDLGADSLDVVDLLMSIEDEFEVEIPDEEVENIPLSKPPVACAVLAAEVSGRARSPSFSVRVMMLVFRSRVKSVT